MPMPPVVRQAQLGACVVADWPQIARPPTAAQASLQAADASRGAVAACGRNLCSPAGVATSLSQCPRVLPEALPHRSNPGSPRSNQAAAAGLAQDSQALIRASSSLSTRNPQLNIVHSL